MSKHLPSDDPVRLDKWLWAARFFKTRTLAREAIDGGKVRVDGQRGKPSKMINVGNVIAVTISHYEKEVVVKALLDKRGPASVAQTLYEETEASRVKYEREKEARQLAHQTAPEKRPDKKQRRLITRFKRQ